MGQPERDSSLKPAAGITPGTKVDPTVVVAVLTYLRPNDVRDAVSAVLAQTEGDGGRTSVLVIDNDPGATAMSLQDAFHGQRVRFVHEPTPGISAARNRALDEAGDADLLIFLDDDERPEPSWLRHMLDTWHRFGATAVIGPVISVFPEEPDPWITAGDYFVRRRMATGTQVDVAGTGNLLLDLAEVRRMGVRFDARFGASGGSDTLFTRQLHQRGGRLVWCDEAIATDVVPASRLTRSWVLRRSLRYGNTWSRVALELAGRAGARLVQRLVMTGEGLARIGAGAGQFLLGVVTASLERRAWGARRLARGVGLVGGAWGWTYTEYRRSS